MDTQNTDLIARQHRDPSRYPVLLCTSAPGDRRTRHILFEATGPANCFDDAVAAREAIAALDWQPGGAQDQPRVGDRGWCFFLAYEFAQSSLPPWCKLPTTAALPLACIQAVRVAEISWATKPEAPQAPVIAREAWTEEPAERFLQGVAELHGWIRSGDVYQVNLSRRWRAHCAADQGADLLRALLCRNAAPFAARAIYPGFEIISSSPERLFDVRGRQLRTQPIAGTRPRSKAAARDAAYQQELLASDKERAEHVMLVDLERNDVGRVCEPGSLRVQKLMQVEAYASVRHIVSEVQGRLCEGMGLAQILDAVFPGGTITGCPKVRCMQLLAGLERRARNAYTGSLGYCLKGGPADFNILIRSLQLHEEELVLDAGAGIVAESVADWELEETRAKARGVIDALAGA